MSKEKKYNYYMPTVDWLSVHVSNILVRASDKI